MTRSFRLALWGGIALCSFTLVSQYQLTHRPNEVRPHFVFALMVASDSNWYGPTFAQVDTAGPPLVFEESPIVVEEPAVEAVELPKVSVSAAAVRPVIPLPPPPRPGTLSRDELVNVLRESGWPEELLDQADAVVVCESTRSTGAFNPGGFMGLFQLSSLWFGYAGEDISLWHDPHVNARAALATYRYDISRGSAPWSQWSCKP